LPAELRAYIASLAEPVRQNVLKILAFGLERAPLQMYNLVTLIVRHSIEVDSMPQKRETIQQQIDFESNLDLSRCIYHRPEVHAHTHQEAAGFEALPLATAESVEDLAAPGK